MKLARHGDAASFLAAAGPFLEEREVENHLVLGLACDLGERGGEAAWLATVEDGGRVVAASLRTPGRELVLSEAPAVAVDAQARWLGAAREELPGVSGPEEEATAFAESFGALTGATWKVHREMRLHAAVAVAPVEGGEGALSLARREDAELAREWAHAFALETRLPGADPERPPERLPALDERRLWLWRTRDGPVSMAQTSRRTARGVAISLVYTPPEHRRRGWAAALVSALSIRELDGGRSFCALFTDRATPAAERLYARVGYLPVADFRHVLFS